jgi:hypothetical protein
MSAAGIDFLSDIVTCCDAIRTQLQRVFKECFKLYFSVTQDVWVWRASCAILLKEVFENFIPILSSEAGGVTFYSEYLADALSVLEIFLGSAVCCAIILVPILHKEPFDDISGFN